MNEKLRVGVIGVGSLGEWHAKNFKELEQAELVGVYDVDPKRCAEIAAKYDTKAFDSIEKLAPEIQAASVVVPANLHGKVAIPLIERGLHLLVEKPIANKVSDAEAMVRLAKKKNVILQVGHIERFNPVMDAIVKLVDKPVYIEAVRTCPFPPARPGLKPRGTEVSVVLDMMIHDIDIVLRIAGSEVCDLQASGVRMLSDSEDMATAQLHFENGCVANITASRISPDRARRIKIYQPGAVLSFDFQSQTGEMLKPSGDAMVAEPVAVEKGESLKRELASFVKCVIERGTPVVPGDHALECLKIAVAICGQISGGVF